MAGEVEDVTKSLAPDAGQLGSIGITVEHEVIGSKHTVYHYKLNSSLKHSFISISLDLNLWIIHSLPIMFSKDVAEASGPGLQVIRRSGRHVLGELLLLELAVHSSVNHSNDEGDDRN